MDYGIYIRLLREMVRIPSVSFEEEAVSSFISAELSALGIEHRRERNNIVAVNRSFSAAKRTLALDAHIDTVPACASYKRDPHDPGIDDDIVWGLGANDDGGSVVSMIAAFAHFYERENLPINLMLTLTVEEERSGEDGSSWLYAPDGFLASSYGLPDWVIVGEPTGMRAATSERGLLVIDGTAHGVSGHAARDEGVNALYIALEDIEALRTYDFDRVSPLMGRVKLSVTQISAGSAHNVIPDCCRFVVDIRPTDCYTNEEILSLLQSRCRSELKARNLRNRSSATREGSPLLCATDALGIATFSSPTTSDWIRLTECDAIKMGPGDSARSHHGDEYIRVDEITQAIDKYIEFIEYLYGNTLE